MHPDLGSLVMGKATTVTWTFGFQELNDDRQRSAPFTFLGERLHLAFIFYRPPGVCCLLLIRQGGRPGPLRPFRLTLESEGLSGGGTHVTLFRGTVSEVPWRKEFHADSLKAKYSLNTPFRMMEARVVCLLEDLRVFSERDSWAQTDICGLTAEESFPSNLDSLSLDFSNLLKDETLPDVTLKCGGRDRAIPAHRAVLAARSEVFAAMFRTEMAESLTGEVDLSDVDDDVIDPFLEYVYSGQVRSGVPEGVLPGLYATADKYSVRSLRETCRDRMVDLLSEENCVGFLTVADAHGDTEFKDTVVSFICAHTTVFRSDAWLDFAKMPTPLAIEVYQSFITRKAGAVRLDGK